MFTENQLAQLDRKYFNVILADGLDVTIQSRNTGHWWYLHCTGCKGESQAGQRLGDGLGQAEIRSWMDCIVILRAGVRA